MLAIPFITLLSACSKLFGILDLNMKPAKLPSWIEIAVHIAVCAVVEEILFYYSHRLMHVPFFYKRIHKIHHEWQAPVALVATYTHPVEFLLSNLVPLACGPLLLRSHITTTWIWFVIATIGTEIHHSGYRFPWNLDHQPNFHDYHHEAFNFNFGLLGWLDKLHGTYKLPTRHLDQPTDRKQRQI
eukprot:TRINITY_DN1425_c0_g1_i3.p1 TRINITY_DN1425_c0_g1~~TRINITY_DN1425_c0_g1_i3.p1  ORF type:complete len:185 (-),score=9.58 TRINITY_DN1425_c0_g1_i3:43-597(-)